MAKSIGTLGELFPDTAIQCRIRGCGVLIPISGEKALQNVADGRAARPDRMCDDCYARFLALEDKPVPCATPGCTKSWTWNRFQQLEGEKQGLTAPPRGFCPQCQSKKSQLKDQEIPCRVKGCKNTFTWTREHQMRDGTETPPARACRACSDKLRELQDRDVPCRVRGCTGTWRWYRGQQLEHLQAGKDAESVPRRMCRECTVKLKALQDATVPCKVRGCSRTWVFSAFSQLEHLLTAGAAEPPSGKMCAECFNFFNSSQDRQIPCKHKGCPGTWTLNRSMQLHDWLAGKTHAPVRACQACNDKLRRTADLHMACMIPGCKGTWKYPAADQVRDACSGRTPSPRRCHECDEFLTQTEATVLACSACGKEISWSAYEQLMCKLGTFIKPSVCSSCAEQVLAMQKPATPPVLRQDHRVVRIPASGRWNADQALVKWPPHLTPETIQKTEHADIRVVALGDDWTWSTDKAETAWPALLEARLNAALEGRAKVAVVNAGMPGTNSRQAVMRWLRDVAPFDPHLVIMSFALQDSWLELDRHDRTWRATIEMDAATAAMNDLFQKARGAHDRLLFWTTSILPQDVPETTGDAGLTGWANAQEASFNQCLAHAVRFCSQHKIPVLDLRTRFEVNGKKSARKWMLDWCRHNESGAQNIATWMAEYILRENLIPQPPQPGAATP